MKKVFIAICLVIAVICGWYVLLGLREAPKIELNRNNEALNKIVTEKNTKVEVIDIEKNNKSLSKSELNHSKNAEDQLSNTQACGEKYQSTSEWKDMLAVVEDIYQDGVEAAGNGAFQQMPIASLRAFAESGDKDAMYHYGAARMWKGALGVYLNYQAKEESWQNPEDYKNIHRNYKPDLDVFSEGEDYAFRAAVKGRLGGVMEVSFMSQMLASKMKKSGSSDDDVLNAIVKSGKYLKLLQSIHKNDRSLLASMNYDDLISILIARVFRNKKNDELKAIREQVNHQVNATLPKLEKRWRDERNVIGLEPSPDLLRPELEAVYNQYMEECVKQGDDS